MEKNVVVETAGDGAESSLGEKKKRVRPPQAAGGAPATSLKKRRRVQPIPRGSVLESWNAIDNQQPAAPATGSASNSLALATGSADHNVAMVTPAHLSQILSRATTQAQHPVSMAYWVVPKKNFPDGLPSEFQYAAFSCRGHYECPSCADELNSEDSGSNTEEIGAPVDWELTAQHRRALNVAGHAVSEAEAMAADLSEVPKRRRVRRTICTRVDPHPVDGIHGCQRCWCVTLADGQHMKATDADKYVFRDDFRVRPSCGYGFRDDFNFLETIVDRYDMGHNVVEFRHEFCGNDSCSTLLSAMHGRRPSVEPRPDEGQPKAAPQPPAAYPG